jgi:ATP-dependent Clp protease adaptor protein ClpS
LPKIKDKVEVADEIKLPSMYKVILHNDNYTSMDFVVMILSDIFHKNQNEAEAIMLIVHEKGKGLCGVYTKEIAYTKANQVKTLAKAEGFPLLTTVEKDV